LRDFYVTIGHPNQTLHVQRSTVGAPTFDDLDRVGLGTDASDGSGGVTVSVVVAGTDASAKGVEVGDVILSVDGVSLANIGATAADAIFAGPVGSTKMVQFGHAASATLSMQTIAIACDDVLPL
jgi:C-terminal processing protease CtpA/Prc